MPKDYRRAVLVAELIGADTEHFRAYWWGEAAMQRYRTPRRAIEYVEEYLTARGGVVDPTVFAEIDHVLGRYQDLAIEHPRPEVLAALDELRAAGLRLGLLSNADEREVRAWMRSPLAARFDAACFSCQVGSTKPDNAAFSAVLAQLGVPARETVFVGDGNSGELAGARAAGFAGVVFMRGFLAEHAIVAPEVIAANERDADVVIDRLGDLRAELTAPSGHAS